MAGLLSRLDVSAALAALAAVLISFSLAVSFGMLDPLALGLVTVGSVAAMGSALTNVRGARGGRGAVLAILGAGLALGLAHDALYLPGVGVDPARLGAFRPTLALAASGLATYLWRRAPAWFARVRFASIVASGCALGALVILASPAPGIDVWQMQQQGASALLAGVNPYRVAYPNVYGPGTPLIAPQLLSPDGRFVLGYPYTPLSLLLVAPAAWLGDVRWTMLAAVGLAAILIRHLGRASVESELAASFLLLQPKAFFMLEMAWTEPVVLALVLATVLAVRRASSMGSAPTSAWRAWLSPGLAAGLAISTKQYVALLLAPAALALAPRVRGKAVVVASAVGIAIALPFAVAGPGEFLRGVVEFQALQPFRPDALSWPAQVAAWGGPVLPSWPAFVLAAATYLLTLRRPPTPSQALLAGATCWLVLVLFNKQAFCNYYWLAAGMLCAAAASPSEE